MKNTPFIDKLLQKIQVHYDKQEQDQPSPDKNYVNKKQTKTQKTQKVSLQNLEKRLNEISAFSIDKKSASVQNIQNKEMQQLPQADQEHKNKVKKMKLCKQFISTGLCRNKDHCIYAHSKKDLKVEYLPDAWVAHFKPIYQIKQEINERKQDLQIQNNQSIQLHKRPQTQQQLQRTDLQQSSNDQQILRDITSSNDGGIQQRAQSSQNFHRKMIPQQNVTKIFGMESLCSIDKIIDKKGKNLLAEVAMQGNPEAVKALLQAGADPTFMDWSGHDSIMYAIKKNYYEIMCLLIDISQHPINLNRQFFTSKITYLMMAAKLGLPDMVIALLASGANPNIYDYRHRSAVFYSVEVNDFDSVFALVENGANCALIDDFNKTCVDYALEKKHLNLISYLFKKGGALADNTKHKQILLFAAENNQIDLLHEMIKRGISPSEVDQNNNNLLMLAFKNQHYDTVIDLIESLNIQNQIIQQNKDGDNVLLLSIKEGKLSLAKYFIARAQNLDFQDKEGKTPLIYASEYGYNEIVEILMEKNVDATKHEKHWKTALIYASKNNQLLVVEALLKYKDKINIGWKDQYELTARNYAKNPSIKSLISQAMIELNQLSDSLIKGLYIQ